jgi:hypothetical protein
MAKVYVVSCQQFYANNFSVDGVFPDRVSAERFAKEAGGDHVVEEFEVALLSPDREEMNVGHLRQLMAALPDEAPVVWEGSAFGGHWLAERGHVRVADGRDGFNGRKVLAIEYQERDPE